MTNHSFGRHKGMSIIDAIKYHAMYLIKWYIPVCSIYYRAEAEAIWAALEASEWVTTVAWCKMCERTKHHKDGQCLGCRG